MVRYLEVKKETDFIKTRLNAISAMGHPFENEKDKMSFINENLEYFRNKDQFTVMAVDDSIIGSATICFFTIVPSFCNNGKCAKIMNVYTDSSFRNQGIATEMLKILLKEAKRRDINEVFLDSSPLGKTVYEKLGFLNSNNRMILNIK